MAIVPSQKLLMLERKFRFSSNRIFKRNVAGDPNHTTHSMHLRILFSWYIFTVLNTLQMQQKVI